MKTCVILLLVATVFALDNGLALTPPMGWLAWEQFHCEIDCTNHPDSCISENLFLNMTDRLAEDGYLEAGYNRINIDDCWSAKERDANNEIIADPIRFSHGIKWLADYVHNKGLLLGIYNDYGTLTCGGYPGSEGYLIQDAKTFVSWGVDALKMDGCYSKVLDHPDSYPAMAHFLNSTGRPILYSCSWPAYAGGKDDYKYYELLPEHCNLWRNYGDINANWAVILNIIDTWGNHPVWRKYAGPGHWNDPDMLLIGIKNGLNKVESESQMALWAILAAPLYMSNDLRNIDDWAKEILLNKEVIAVDQDRLGIQGYRITVQDTPGNIFVRELDNNEWAIALLNRSGEPIKITVKFADFCKQTHFNLRDLFAHKDLGAFDDEFTSDEVPAHGTLLLRATL